MASEDRSPPRPLCRLYLVVPAGTTVAALNAALDGGDVGCIRLQEPEEALREVAQGRDVACFLEDAHGAGRYDGIHLTDAAGFAEARASAGMVGVAADSRHDALEAAEAGADYVALSGAELVAWWAELMEVPCAAEGATTLDEAVELAKQGADFVSLGSAIWNHPDGPKTAVEALNAAIAATRPG